MMNQALQDQVAASLRRCCRSVHEAGLGVWHLALPTLATTASPAHGVTARMEADWLLFDAPLGDIACPPDGRGEVLRRLLQANGELAGGAKFALIPGRSSVRLRAELPLGQEADRPDPIGEVWTGISAAWALWHDTRKTAAQGNGGNGAVTESGRMADDGAMRESIRDGCCATGWTLHERPDGPLLIDLEVPGRYLQAEVSGAPDGGVLVRVDIAAAEADAPPPCGTALVIFLLQLSAVVRQARPTVGRLEVVLPAVPTASALAGALSALSVAARMAEQEARLLVVDEALARAYLTVCATGESGCRDTENERVVMCNRAGGSTETPPAPQTEGSEPWEMQQR